MRLVDPCSSARGVDDFDFDMTIERFASRDARRFAAAVLLLAGGATKGSYNLAGIADPVIDALIEKILAVNTRRRT
jgi:microcin C transport system substrate-binding protein